MASRGRTCCISINIKIVGVEFAASDIHGWNNQLFYTRIRGTFAPSLLVSHSLTHIYKNVSSPYPAVDVWESEAGSVRQGERDELPVSVLGLLLADDNGVLLPDPVNAVGLGAVRVWNIETSFTILLPLCWLLIPRDSDDLAGCFFWLMMTK